VTCPDSRPNTPTDAAHGRRPTALRSAPGCPTNNEGSQKAALIIPGVLAPADKTSEEDDFSRSAIQ
jgi:hypothetical protein